MAPHAPILILQHIACEPPAAYGEELLARGLELHCVRLDLGDALPDWRSFAAIVAMGGPMGAYDESAYPWLAAEKRFIAEAVRGGVPFWGVCLGAQLLAASLGGAVTPGPSPEVGVGAVELTDAAARDPVLACAPAVFDALHWHGDTYALPQGASCLASSAQYEQQAFALGRGYGLQFHLEVPPGLAREWIEVPAYRQSLEQVMGRDGPVRLIEQLERAAPGSRALARRLLGRWLDTPGSPPRSGSS